MNTYHISTIISSSSGSSRTFKGVFARDQFVNQEIVFPGLYVFNTDNINQAGSHWVAAYFSKEQKCEYFDSYGIAPLFDDVINKFLSIDNSFVCNQHILQSFNTNVCGIYCIIYSVMKCKGYDLHKIIDLFLTTANDDERDHVLRYFIDFNFPLIISEFGRVPSIHDVGASSLQICKLKAKNLH